MTEEKKPARVWSAYELTESRSQFVERRLYAALEAELADLQLRYDDLMNKYREAVGELHTSLATAKEEISRLQSEARLHNTIVTQLQRAQKVAMDLEREKAKGLVEALQKCECFSWGKLGVTCRKHSSNKCIRCEALARYGEGK